MKDEKMNDERISFNRIFYLLIGLSIIFSSSIFLSACTPTEQQFIEKPSGSAKFEKDIFYTADMASLPYRAWLPKDKSKAVVVALHGFNDYSNAFSSVGPYFSARGIAFYAYDQRGFGHAPNAGTWGNRYNLVSDLEQFAASVSKRHPRAPLYILGESMGGAVAIVALAEKEIPAKGLILSAPAIWGGDTMPLIYRTMLWSAAHAVPGWELTGRDLKIMATDNLELLRKMSKDPLVIKSTRIDAMYGLVGLMDKAYEDIPKLKVPTLLLYGGNDQVIRKDPIEVGLARFSHPLTFAFYPKGYHMLMRDLDGEVVMKDAASWLLRPKSPLPSGFGSEITPSQ